MVSTIADAIGNEALTLAGPGTGTGDEPTYEIDGYDEFGQLVSVMSDNYVASYGYNADGLRVSKEVTQGGATETTRYLYEGGLVTLEMNGICEQTAYNVYGGESIISRDVQNGFEYYVYNGRGDVVQLTTSWSYVTVEYDYDAFGNLLDEYQSDTNPFRYCGEYWDDETKNYYLRSRYYRPKTGRFNQRDSYLGRYMDPLSLNRYTYTHNNPIRYKDPSGHVLSEWDKANLSAADKQKILNYTAQWDYYASIGNKAGATRVAAAAAAVRDPYLSSGQKVGSDGLVVNANGTIATNSAANAYLSELAAAAGGTVSVSSRTGAATVTVNGITQNFNPDLYATQNGKMMINNKEFDKLFTGVVTKTPSASVTQSVSSKVGSYTVSASVTTSYTVSLAGTTSVTKTGTVINTFKSTAEIQPLETRMAIVGGLFENFLDMSKLNDMTIDDIIKILPKDWSYNLNYDRLHVRGPDSDQIRIRTDPVPDDHVHLYDEDRNLLDKDGKPVNENDPAGHQPFRGKGSDDDDNNPPSSGATPNADSVPSTNPANPNTNPSEPIQPDKSKDSIDITTIIAVFGGIIFFFGTGDPSEFISAFG
jgi:RHS repeat-associated protein